MSVLAPKSENLSRPSEVFSRFFLSLCVYSRPSTALLPPANLTYPDGDSGQGFKTRLPPFALGLGRHGAPEGTGVVLKIRLPPSASGLGRHGAPEGTWLVSGVLHVVLGGCASRLSSRKAVCACRNRRRARLVLSKQAKGPDTTRPEAFLHFSMTNVRCLLLLLPLLLRVLRLFDACLSGYLQVVTGSQHGLPTQAVKEVAATFGKAVGTSKIATKSQVGAAFLNNKTSVLSVDTFNSTNTRHTVSVVVCFPPKQATRLTSW